MSLVKLLASPGVTPVLALALTIGACTQMPSRKQNVEPAAEGTASTVGDAKGAAASPAGEPHGAGHAPVRMTLTGPREGQTGSSTLVLRLERTAIFADLPASLRLELPAGAVLERGSAVDDLGTGPTVERTFVIRAAAIPAGDVVAVVSMAGEGRTAKGEARYRFGRPEPRLAEPPRVAPPGGRRGGSMGTGVKVEATDK